MEAAKPTLLFAQNSRLPSNSLNCLDRLHWRCVIYGISIPSACGVGVSVALDGLSPTGVPWGVELPRPAVASLTLNVFCATTAVCVRRSPGSAGNFAVAVIAA